MELTRKQQEGLEIAIQRYLLDLPYTCIAGYAGSGKSTLVRFIIEALPLEPKEVAYVAYTGKAAKVLAEKGNPNATTIHKLIYKAKQMPNGSYRYSPVPKIELIQKYKVIIVDEVSMVPKQMWEQLLSYGIYIIACGDPGQLPPIDKDADNHVLDLPHVFLNEIMRQAQESEIIKLSMDIREGKPLRPFVGKEVQIIKKSDLVTGMYTWADQILVATNAQRVSINNQMREMAGRGPEPEIGDKVISLRNHWENFSDLGAPLTNGTIGYLHNFESKQIYLPAYIYKGAISVLSSSVIDEAEGIYDNLPIDLKCLKTGEMTLEPRQEYQLRKNKDYAGPIPMDFSYAYAITVHKAQGSEWDNVLIVEEKFPFDPEEHRRWLYTAVTRAAKKVVLVLK